MGKASTILAQARQEIKSFINFELPLLYKKIYGCDKEEDENYSICTGDLKSPIFINVEVDNSYLDVDDTCYERREIAEIVLEEDDSLTFIEEEGEEWSDSDITIDELAMISESIQEAYSAK